MAKFQFTVEQLEFAYSYLLRSRGTEVVEFPRLHEINILRSLVFLVVAQLFFDECKHDFGSLEDFVKAMFSIGEKTFIYVPSYVCYIKASAKNGKFSVIDVSNNRKHERGSKGWETVKKFYSTWFYSTEQGGSFDFSFPRLQTEDVNRLQKVIGIHRGKPSYYGGSMTPMPDFWPIEGGEQICDVSDVTLSIKRFMDLVDLDFLDKSIQEYGQKGSRGQKGNRRNNRNRKTQKKAVVAEPITELGVEPVEKPEVAEPEAVEAEAVEPVVAEPVVCESANGEDAHTVEAGVGQVDVAVEREEGAHVETPKFKFTRRDVEEASLCVYPEFGKMAFRNLIEINIIRALVALVFVRVHVGESYMDYFKQGSFEKANIPQFFQFRNKHGELKPAISVKHSDSGKTVKVTGKQAIQHIKTLYSSWMMTDSIKGEHNIDNLLISVSANINGEKVTLTDDVKLYTDGGFTDVKRFFDLIDFDDSFAGQAEPTVQVSIQKEIVEKRSKIAHEETRCAKGKGKCEGHPACAARKPKEKQIQGKPKRVAKAVKAEDLTDEQLVAIKAAREAVYGTFDWASHNIGPCENPQDRKCLAAHKSSWVEECMKYLLALTRTYNYPFANGESPDRSGLKTVVESAYISLRIIGNQEGLEGDYIERIVPQMLKLLRVPEIPGSEKTQIHPDYHMWSRSSRD